MSTPHVVVISSIVVTAGALLLWSRLQHARHGGEDEDNVVISRPFDVQHQHLAEIHEKDWKKSGVDLNKKVAQLEEANSILEKEVEQLRKELEKAKR